MSRSAIARAHYAAYVARKRKILFPQLTDFGSTARGCEPVAIPILKRDTGSAPDYLPTPADEKTQVNPLPPQLPPIPPLAAVQEEVELSAEEGGGDGDGAEPSLDRSTGMPTPIRTPLSPCLFS